MSEPARVVLEQLNALLTFYDKHKPAMMGQKVQAHMTEPQVAKFATKTPAGYSFRGYIIVPLEGKKKP
ncbi:hypothetical protein UFOVP119_50 [uncultured Caudovirales phage]|uniref:Uncharacterized protein n=1 Tax=uncultured Caudovirales phage TaxID=2100421 RepID=A0A6J5LB07_9CAUD|nr:hypothetical protein UFOVP119_50 [uncultured Caudovirales phage]